MITVQSRPFDIDFIDNKPKFVLRRNSASITQVKCRFKFSHTSSNLSSYSYTPYMYFDFNAEGLATVSTVVLKGFFEDIEIPRYDDGLSGVKIVNHEIYYRLEMCEISNGVESSPVYTNIQKLMNGFVEEYRHDNNLPDWISGGNNAKLGQRGNIDIYGQDNDDTISVYRGSEQYMYIRNYENTSITLSPILTVTLYDGTVSTITPGAGIGFYSFSIPAKSLQMLRCDLGAFGSIGVDVSDVISYSLTFWSLGLRVRRNFVITAPPYDMKTIMLKNRLNLYETFCIDNIKKELSVSGDSILVNGYDEYNVTDTEIIYTARTGLLNQKRILLLHSGLLKNGNLMLDGQWASYISIVPGSWTVIDQKEDLMEVEFQYKLGRKIARPYGTHEVPTPTVTGSVTVSSESRITTSGVYNRTSIEI